jgi:DNA-directed RNA polymerase specialized sigma24 family protein
MFDYVWSDEFPEIPEDVLNKNQRDVVYLKYVCGMRFEEIATEVCRRRDAVIRSHSQALRRIEEFVTVCRLLKDE